MYNLQEIAKRIKSKAKTNGTNLKPCFLIANWVSIQFLKCQKEMICFLKNLSRIADYLDCSVDYLLGRTDNPNINR